MKDIPAIEQLYPDNIEIPQEVTLWRAVVIQNLDDLLLPASNHKYRIWRQQAIKWFMKADEDFYSVCEYANLSPGKVQKIAYKRLLKTYHHL